MKDFMSRSDIKGIDEEKFASEQFSVVNLWAPAFAGVTAHSAMISPRRREYSIESRLQRKLKFLTENFQRQNI
jgi:hypothetical protein